MNKGRLKGRLQIGALLFFIIGIIDFAEASDSWRIKSDYDEFVLEKNSESFLIDNKPVSKSKVSNFLEIMNLTKEVSCPHLIEGPQIIVINLKSTKKPQIEVFLHKSLVRRDEKCFSVPKKTLRSFPSHKVWFVGQSTLSLPIGNSLKFTIDGQSVLIDRKKNIWFRKGSKRWLNQEFLDEVEKQLNPFTVDYRAHHELFEYTSFLTMVINGKKYVIGSLSGDWGIQFPGTKWFVVSKNFEIFKRFLKREYNDPNGERLTKLINYREDLQNRISLIRDLRSKPSENLYYVGRAVLKNSANNELVRIEAADLLFERPTIENMKAMVGVLNSETNPRLLRRIIQHLRAINPSGPIFKPNDSETERQKKYRVWKGWLDQYSSVSK